MQVHNVSFLPTTSKRARELDLDEPDPDDGPPLIGLENHLWLCALRLVAGEQFDLFPDASCGLAARYFGVFAPTVRA